MAEFPNGEEALLRATIAILGLSLIFLPTTSAADEGESIYKAQCLKCHGADGDGKGHAEMKIKPADLRSDAVQKLSDEELYKTIAYGVGHKDYAHGFAARGLSAKQIAEVVTYIRKFVKPAKTEK
jgi:mono/diheme cytochrome c family protein